MCTFDTIRARRLSKATITASLDAGDSDVSDDAALMSAENESSDDDADLEDDVDDVDDVDDGAEELLEEAPNAEPVPKKKRLRKKVV